MIITKPKDHQELLRMLEGVERLFITGCSECATVCGTGGEKEVQETRTLLEEEGKVVTGTIVLEPACHLLNDKRLLKAHKEALENSDAVLCLACGNGVQTVAKASGIRSIPGLDTVFLGQIERQGHFSENCAMCGKCLLGEFASFCPIALCPKRMLNGPCGGSKEGKCEVDENLDCVWCNIHDAFEEQGALEVLERIVEAKDWSLGQGSRPKRIGGSK